MKNREAIQGMQRAGFKTIYQPAEADSVQR